MAQCSSSMIKNRLRNIIPLRTAELIAEPLHLYHEVLANGVLADQKKALLLL